MLGIIIHVVTSDCISITSILTLTKCCVINFIEPRWTQSIPYKSTQ